MIQLKNKPPYPIESIATAIGLSPTSKELIAETRRMCLMHDAKMILIHVGDINKQKQKLFAQYLDELQIPLEDAQIIFEEGDVVEVILRNCKQHAVDLLIIGALKKESFFKRYFFSSVARNLSRQAKCSILMLTEPSLQPKGFKRIIATGIDHPKTQWTLETATYLAMKEKSKELYILKEVYIPGLRTMLADDYTKEEEHDVVHEVMVEARLHCQSMIDVIQKKFEPETKIKLRVVMGKPGMQLATFTKTKKADLLMINSPDQKLGFMNRIFPFEIEHILADLPCNLFIVHSRGF